MTFVNLCYLVQKYNLNDVDGWGCFSYVQIKRHEFFAGRQQRGQYVKIWTAFWYCGEASLVFIAERQLSEKCIEALESSLLHFGEILIGPNWVL